MTYRSLAAFLTIACFMGPAGDSSAKAQEKTKPSGDSSNASSSSEPGKDNGSEASNKNSKEKSKPKMEKATFGGGCFWCLEAVFERIPGVTSVVSGYAGGTVPSPTYEMVCSGLTGHAEVVQITYDPSVAPYEKLLKVFWACHDPTTLNQQGPDFGTQYRSVIFYHNDEQKKAAIKSVDELTAAQAFGDPIVTQLQPLPRFFPAEAYHQNYYRLNRNAPYCQAQIVPKLRKLKLIK